MEVKTVPQSIRTVPELIPVLGSHKPGGKLPLLSTNGILVQKNHFSFSFYIVLVFQNIFILVFIQFRCSHFYFYFI